jgi:glycosyltransferase involved in cell wall biosynthesis
MLKKVLFVHDHVFHHDSAGNYYSEGKLPLSAFDRFLEIAETVNVLCRKKALDKIPSKSKFDLSSSNNVRFYPVKGRGWMAIFVFQSWWNFKNIYTLIKRSNLVVIRAPCFLSLAVIPLTFVLKKPYAVEVVGDAYEAISSSKNRNITTNLLAKIFDWFTRLVIYNADAAVYVTEVQLQNRYPSIGLTGSASNVSIPDFPQKNIIERLNRMRQRASIDCYRIGIIGSFKNRHKGIDILIESVRKLRQEKSINVSLEIVGSGDMVVLQKELKRDQDSSDWIRFMGSLDKKSVFEWLDNLDVYCQPSRTEGLPRALIEAMSRGCPAIATSVGGMPELLQEECLVSVEDSSGLGKCIERMLLDHDFALSQSLRNFNRAKRYYDSELRVRRSAFWLAVAEDVQG